MKKEIGYKQVNIGDKVYYVVLQDWFVVENIVVKDDKTYFISTHEDKEIGMEQGYITDFIRGE